MLGSVAWADLSCSCSLETVQIKCTSHSSQQEEWCRPNRGACTHSSPDTAKTPFTTTPNNGIIALVSNQGALMQVMSKAGRITLWFRSYIEERIGMGINNCLRFLPQCIRAYTVFHSYFFIFYRIMHMQAFIKSLCKNKIWLPFHDIRIPFCTLI